MSARITSIVGVICLGILPEIVLPQGKRAKAMGVRAEVKI